MDPGDDTIARFHYQFATAAIHAINIARGVGSAKAIICENFEDIILERHDSKFDAIQVKTSDRHRPPFKLSDNAVEKSLIRFIKLNMKFPGQFSGFYFETNHEMWSDKENSQNAEWVINEIRRNPRVKGLRRTNGKRAAVDKLRVRSNAPVDVVVETLSKTNFRSRKEDVTSVHSLLHQAMLTHPQCCDLKYHRIIALSDALIAAVFRASSRAQIAFSDRLYEVDG
ncbi:dsDNA nuclease domain-containing protein [Sulfitobacter sp. 1A12056]|uniref:dsDNA nuclease domain-containing protein n=1 Tax=Sulfitobacter sp. 1A12056 TaxID=3368592 RepID=UPI003746EDC1